MVGLLALVVAAAFTGAAVYVSAVEQPARLALDDRAMLAQWKPAYARGSIMQAGLALLACLLGAVAAWQSGDSRWLVGAALSLLPWPWTLLAIMPVNRTLKAMPAAEAGPEARTLLHRWNRLHLVRVALGLAATLAYLWMLV
ncbi:MAG TPA: DUF1772 domain-containing protein [Kiloniellales bacterium]|nr:DUF1772 domain-containing protein [Kiloniellales bacterium]